MTTSNDHFRNSPAKGDDPKARLHKPFSVQIVIQLTRADLIAAGYQGAADLSDSEMQALWDRVAALAPIGIDYNTRYLMEDALYAWRITQHSCG